MLSKEYKFSYNNFGFRNAAEKYNGILKLVNTQSTFKAEVLLYF